MRQERRSFIDHATLDVCVMRTGAIVHEDIQVLTSAANARIRLSGRESILPKSPDVISHLAEMRGTVSISG